MRHIFIVVGLFLASVAQAQTMPGMAEGAGTAQPASTAAVTTGMTADGRMQVGYEGRGNYLKNAQIAKERANPGRYLKKEPETAGMAATGQPMAAPGQPMAAAAAATANGNGSEAMQANAAAQHARSDAFLRSDARKAMATTVEPAAVQQPQAPQQPQAMPMASPYQPPVFVGGRRVN